MVGSIILILQRQKETGVGAPVKYGVEPTYEAQ